MGGKKIRSHARESRANWIFKIWRFYARYQLETLCVRKKRRFPGSFPGRWCHFHEFTITVVKLIQTTCKFASQIRIIYNSSKTIITFSDLSFRTRFRRGKKKVFHYNRTTKRHVFRRSKKTTTCKQKRRNNENKKKTSKKKSLFQLHFDKCNEICFMTMKMNRVQHLR